MVIASQLNNSILSRDRPIGLILQARLVRRRDATRPVPAWAYMIRSLSVAEFLQDFRRYVHLAEREGGKDKPQDTALASMAADRLMALFLKLNITDPANDDSTQEALHDLLLELKRQQTTQASEQAEETQEQMEAAEAAKDPVAAVINHLLSLLGL